MSLLPSRPDAEPAEDAGPRVVGVDDEAADDVLSALSSGTARRVLAELHDDPAPPSELADRVDTSLQNVQYHLEKLETCGAVEVVETAYSAKGREMDVYAPADRPLVVFAGDQKDESTLRTALARLLGAVGLLAVGSLIVQAAFGELSLGLGFGAGGDGGGGGEGGGGSGGDAASDGAAETVTSTATEAADGADVGVSDAGTPTPEATGVPEMTEAGTEAMRQAQPAAEGAGGLPPGLLFFAGGLFVLAVVVAVWYVR
jgi:DNA-binding transcriptional ArsR family regulator